MDKECYILERKESVKKQLSVTYTVTDSIFSFDIRRQK